MARPTKRSKGVTRRDKTPIQALLATAPAIPPPTIVDKGGHPLKFATPEILKECCQRYFNSCRKAKRPITTTGLALALGTNREVLMDYARNYGDRFTSVMLWAKTVCHNYAEERLYIGNPTGPIFALKNFGWKDTSYVGTIDLGNIPALDKSRADLIIKRLYANTGIDAQTPLNIAQD
jgi:hypothetical protein